MEKKDIIFISIIIIIAMFFIIKGSNLKKCKTRIEYRLIPKTYFEELESGNFLDRNMFIERNL